MKRSEPYIVGLTGGIACGKSHVARFLRDLGVPVIDADAISRSLTAEGGEALPAIRAAFGDGVFSGETLDRRALGEVVFGDAEKRKKLEDILHPLIIARMQRETEASGRPIVGWDVPLLYETGIDARCGEVWCVYITASEQLRRVMRRDRLTENQAKARIKSQMPMEEKKTRAAHLINTMHDYGTTRRRVRGLLRDLQRRLRFE